MKTRIIRMPQIGNCLFDAISYGLYRNINKSLDLRKAAVKYIKSHESFFLNFLEVDIDEYINEMAKPGTYGDELILVSLSKLLKVKIIVINHLTKKIINTYKNGSYKIYLLYNSEYEHYDYLHKVK